MAHEAGKGSARRPSDIPQEIIDDNWDRIFGKKKAVLTIEPPVQGPIVAEQNGVQPLFQTTQRGLTHVSIPIDESGFVEQKEIYDPYLTVNS